LCAFLREKLEELGQKGYLFLKGSPFLFLTDPALDLIYRSSRNFL